MRKFVLTGAPGAGKTTLIDALARRGYPVTAEAATDLIARQFAAGADQAWDLSGAMDDLLALQLDRERAVTGPVVFLDRSPLCTLALARYNGLPVGPALAAAARAAAYERDVFLIEPLGFVTPTEARRISYADSLRFAAIHVEVYRAHGYRLVPVPAGPVEQRVAQIEAHVRAG